MHNSERKICISGMRVAFFELYLGYIWASLDLPSDVFVTKIWQACFEFFPRKPK